MYPAAKTQFNLKNDKQWLDILIRSVREPVIDSFEMPRFPHGAIQRQFVGSADDTALREGFAFYEQVKKYSAQLNVPLNATSKFLDFGSGWGRYTRLFWNDVAWDNIYGVDIDPEMIAVCRALRAPGSYVQIDPRGQLPFDDNFFDCSVAYSVFSHLPQEIAEHWMAELSRVTKPGGLIAYTTEARRFLDFILSIQDPNISSWHGTLSKFKELIPALYAEYDKGNFVYIPTSGGKYRSADVYGEACIPEAFIKNKWSKYFKLVDYIDDKARFFQAFVVAQKG